VTVVTYTPRTTQFTRDFFHGDDLTSSFGLHWPRRSQSYLLIFASTAAIPSHCHNFATPATLLALLALTKSIWIIRHWTGIIAVNSPLFRTACYSDLAQNSLYC
jgi:hypothetical protein